MAWEWVAPVATSVATLGVGVAGIVATYMAGNRQQDSALAVTQQQVDGQIAVAREERRQRRLEAAYQELLAVLSHTYAWVLTVYPTWSKAGEYTMPPMPELPDKARTEALLTAYWSPRVQQLMDPWRDALTDVNNAGVAIAKYEDAVAKGRGDDLADLALQSKRNLPGFRDAVWAADERLREQVRRELLGEHDGSAQPAAPQE